MEVTMVDLPDYDAVQDALAEYMFAINNATLPVEAYWSLAQSFNLTVEQLALRRRDGRGSAWENRVQWARRKLVEAGVMAHESRGIWCLAAAASRKTH
jgi:restriction endonuclease Mrr